MKKIIQKIQISIKLVNIDRVEVDEMKYEKPNMNIVILSEDMILTSFIDIDEWGGNDPDEEITVKPPTP